MGRRAPDPNRVIDRDKFKAKLAQKSMTEADLWRQLGLDANTIGTMRKRISQGHAFEEHRLNEMATLLECASSEIVVGAGSSAARPSRRRADAGERLPEVWSAAKMAAKYRDLGSSNFVCIFSMDGFLEAEEESFFDIVYPAVADGLEIMYFFPDSELARKSIQHFDEIAAKFASLLGDRRFTERVKAYFVNAESSYICTRGSRFVLIGHKNDGSRRTDEIFIYIRSDGDYWVKLTLDEHLSFLPALENAIDSVPYYSLRVSRTPWKLHDAVQPHYHGSFSRTDGQTYSELSRLAETGDTAGRIAVKAAEHFRELEAEGAFSKDHVLRWLDIGCHDGVNTQIIFDQLSKDYKIHLTAIDTSLQIRRSISEALRLSPFYNGPQWTFERFCHELPRSTKFDIITSLHSWYVIDPIHLLDAYRRLSRSGILLVTISPFRNSRPSTENQADRSVVPKGNFINTITGIIDRLLAANLGRRHDQDAYLYKIIKEDAYRNYAEDIEKACMFFFGEPGADFDVESNPRDIPAAKVLDSESLTEAGKAISRFFIHGRDSDVGDLEDLYSAIYAELSNLVEERDGTKWLPAWEWDFSVDRARIGARRQADLKFTG